jgi:F0F1-type ATP synthase assembly protein I
MKTRLIPKAPSKGADEGWAVMTTLLGGFIVWGGIGWLLDRWWETKVFTPIGLIVGMALGIYAVVAKFGLLHGPEEKRPTDPADEPPPASSRRENQCP